MTVPIGQATLLVVGALDHAATEDLHAKFDVLCGYPHIGCVVIDLRATAHDRQTSTLVCRLRVRARRLGKNVVVRYPDVRAVGVVGTPPGALA